MFNYIPEPAVYQNPQTLRFWCQKVLPLVYDDSLSYYELLCKVVDYLNKTISDLQLSVSELEKLKTDFSALVEYVNTYFNDLDITEAVHGAIDNMADSGELLTIMTPYLNETTENITIRLDAQDNKIDDVESDVDEIDAYTTEQISGMNTAIDNNLTYTVARLDAQDAEIADIKNRIGTPTVVTDTSQMTDHNKIYIYKGSQPSMISGNWYYWNGTAWVSGGVYNAAAINTDKTLTIQDVAADAQATGVVRDIVKDFNAWSAPYLFDVGNSITNHGLTATNLGYGKFRVQGTSDAVSNLTLIDTTQKAWNGFTPGMTIYCTVTGSIPIQVYTKATGGSYSLLLTISPTGDQEQTFTIPQNSVDVLIRTRSDSGTTVNETCTFIFTTRRPNYTVPERDVFKSGYDITVTGDNINFNSLTENKAYLVHVNNTTTNAPTLNGTLCWLFCVNSNTITYQYAVDFGARKNVYTRSRLGSDWGEWIYLGGTDIFKSDPNGLASCDLNTLLTNNFYLLYSSQEYDNLPTGHPATGFLMVMATGGWCLQLLFSLSAATVYKRRTPVANVNWSEWLVLGGNGNTYYNTNEYTFNTYEQTVNVDATPTIISDASQFLQSTNDVTDRTADILALLTTTGVCRLGCGVFYVKDLIMPANTSIIGSGVATVIHPTASATFCVSLKSNCTVKDVSFADANHVINETIGDTTALVWEGDYSQSQTAPEKSIITNVNITGFGSGIKLYNTGYGINNGVTANNINISNCDAGINVSYWSEYNHFENIKCYNCWYGCVNNGGNNMFVNCGFSRNKIGFLMDNEYGQSPNNSHGSCIGCTFNHSNNNEGYGIVVLNCNNGFVFNGCQMFFSKIKLNDSEGVIFSNNVVGYSNCNIEIDGGGCHLFSGNMFQAKPPITINNNAVCRFVNNYNKTTGLIVEP